MRAYAICILYIGVPAMSTKLERVDAIVKEVNRGRYPSVAALCDKFEIKPRTLHEDIRFIKDRMRIELVFDKNKNGYFNSTPNAKLPEFDLSPDELMALVLSKEMLLKYSGKAFRIQLEEALEKIVGRLVNSGTLSEEQMRSVVQFIPGGVAETDGKLLRQLKDACNKQFSIEIDYYAAYTGLTSTRMVDPYKVQEFQGAWYIVGWCHMRKELRHFAVHRIRDYKILRKKFEVKAGVNVEEWISSAFQLEHGDGEQLVRIKFTPVGARFALERIWHPSQKVTTHSDGACTLEFKTQSLDEVKRWVLRFGCGAEVIDPPDLRQRVMEELKLTLKGYGFEAS